MKGKMSLNTIVGGKAIWLSTESCFKMQMVKKAIFLKYTFWKGLSRVTLITAVNANVKTDNI